MSVLVNWGYGAILLGSFSGQIRRNQYFWLKKSADCMREVVKQPSFLLGKTGINTMNKHLFKPLLYVL